MLTREEVIWAFRFILGREPENEATIESHRELMDRGALRAALLSSKEFLEGNSGPPFDSAPRNRTRGEFPDPFLTYEMPTWIFIHIEKTAGTSIQNMLLDAFDSGSVYHEHDDTLQWHCAADLSRFSVFAGHFNYDSLFLIPRRHIMVATFVADPAKRIVSLYRFWRAHRPDAPNYHELMALASDNDLVSFLQHDSVRRSHAVFNHMTYCVLGRRHWAEWFNLLENSPVEDRANVLVSIAVAIEKRVAELSFVGLKERFEKSCEVLFRLMNRPQPTIRHDHSLKALAERLPYIVPTKDDKVPVNYWSVVEPLIELDRILYRAAVKAFEGQMARASEITNGADRR